LRFDKPLGFVVDRWSRENGYRRILVIAIPLILSTGSWSIQHFVDRMFLTWYSADAVAAAMPAGMLNFTAISLFMGTSAYVSTFVAQYHGAGRYERIGPALWQGLYIALIGGVAILALVPLAGPIFRFVGHEAAVQQQEIAYFRILCLGSVAPIASAAMAGFFSGRGRTWPILWANALSTPVNVVANYALIFGHWGFPELGIEGAAIATLISAFTTLLIYLVLLSRRDHDLRYHTVRGWRYDRHLFGRLMKFGLPNGVQFFIDMAAFTTFILFMGRLGTVPLAATSIAFNIGILAFMPMVGVGIAVSVLVGQAIGKEQPDLAARGVYSAAHLTLFYMTTVAALYVLAPGLFLYPFAARADPESFTPIRAIAVVALRFIAVFSLFDALNIVFASALRGAGDTRFIMLVIIILSTFVLVIPSYLAIVVLHADVFVGWSIASAWIIAMGMAFLLRFLGGKWRSMRVIERAAPRPGTREGEAVSRGY
jgi:MATE family multidrug resistance protein